MVELYWKHAPNTCRNFAELSRRGYYNNTIFHRIIPDFMIQGMKHKTFFNLRNCLWNACFVGGDPTGTGRGGSSIYGGEFADEIHQDLRHSGAGILSMANSGPDTNGSQFFITLAPCQHLDGKHAIFGRINSGMPIVKRIGIVETDNDDRPTEPVKIISTIVDK